ncbi:hypothetical protein [Fibrella forsythiae]|uniref:Uncharacterized protein n=1 Tax=Fibrella forsythiae TaxID=2817061 RepID=A0ABS3JV18_9BACT|nr:hypothetical protein [Fibrella forsythiae]MBO0953308.1 hypothetical protein [Fibrella forsythiae]
MAKEKLGLKNTLGLSPRVALKKSDIDLEQTEKAVKEIHSTQGDIKRVSIDMPLELFKAMKIKIVGTQTARDYILNLIKNDLG